MEEEIKIDAGNDDSFFVAEGGIFFGIAFDKIFQRPELKPFSIFNMNSKRNFKNLSFTILETFEEIFFNEGGRFDENLELILFNILNAKAIITGNDQTSYDDFIKLVDKITDDGDKLLIKKINTFVEENYALDLDKITASAKEKKKKVNEELQFSDKHAITLLKIAYLYRIMIPTISNYFSYNKAQFKNSGIFSENEDIEDFEFEEINSKIFAYLFEKFADNAEALRNKLYKLTYSRVSKTSYSDHRFWAKAKNIAITKETESLEIYKKLLTNALPKLSIDGDKNIVSFFQSVINNQIDFLFQNKFKYNVSSLGTTADKYASEDDDIVTDFERLEIQTTRKDEGSYLIRKLNIQEIIKKIPEYFDVSVEDAEVKILLPKLNRNTIQEEIIAMLSFKYFKDKQALKFIDFYQYCFLLIACKKYLEKHKFKYLPQMLTAICEKHKERANICGKKVRPEILSSKKYKDLFESKFRNFGEEVEKPFLAFIGTTYSSIFKNDEGEEIFDSSIKVGKIAEELVDLAFLV